MKKAIPHRSKKGRARRIFTRALFVTTFVAIAVAIVGPLTYDEKAHAVLDTTSRQFSGYGNQLLGLDITAPRQNIFSFVRDVDKTVEVIDHATVHNSKVLGLTNFVTRGKVRTVADALRWYGLALTTRQAKSIGLCRSLDAIRESEAIVIQSDPFQQGVASWYGPGFHGRVAASGEIFNMFDQTAAHRTVPLQSLVRVVSQRTGVSTIVRINDRGPYVDGRIIDMSRRSMDLIGGTDLAAVYLEIINPDALKVLCP